MALPAPLRGYSHAMEPRVIFTFESTMRGESFHRSPNNMDIGAEELCGAFNGTMP